MKTTSIILSLALAACVDAHGASSGLTAQQIRTAAPGAGVDLAAGAAAEGSSLSLLRADAQLTVKNTLGEAHGGSACTSRSSSSCAFVGLQVGTPGTAQTGNINISGTMITGAAGAFLVNAGASYAFTPTGYCNGGETACWQPGVLGGGKSLLIGGTPGLNIGGDGLGDNDGVAPLFPMGLSVSTGAYIEAATLGGTLLLGSLAQTAVVKSTAIGGIEAVQFDTPSAVPMVLGLTHATNVTVNPQLNVNVIDARTAVPLELGQGTATKVSAIAPFTSRTTENWIGSETGSNNAIAGALADISSIPLGAGLKVCVLLAHTLQAGANTFVLNGTSKSIKSSRNTGNDIATAYTSGTICMVYDGTRWLDTSQ